MISMYVHKEIVWCSLCVQIGICPCGKPKLTGIWTTTKKTTGGQGKLCNRELHRRGRCRGVAT